jgi:hypothetical protein
MEQAHQAAHVGSMGEDAADVVKGSKDLFY